MDFRVAIIIGARVIGAVSSTRAKTRVIVANLGLKGPKMMMKKKK